MQSESRLLSVCALAVLGLSAVVPPPPATAVEAPQTAAQDTEHCSACSAHPHREAAPSREDVLVQLATFAREPMTADSPALEWLLYHGDHVREFIAGADLDPARREFLEGEIARDRADIELRIVTRDGTVRATASGSTRLGEKVHLMPEHNDLGIDFGGSVLRVGLHHLWSRF